MSSSRVYYWTRYPCSSATPRVAGRSHVWHEMAGFMFATIILLIACSSHAAGNIASALARGFSTDTQLSTAEQSVRQIPFEYFNEKPSYGIQHHMSVGEFTTYVGRLASDFGIPKDIESSILDGIHAEVNREIVKEIRFSKGNPGTVTYGQVSTLRHADGRIDMAHTIHHVSFKLKPDIIKKKKKKRFLGIKVGSRTKYIQVERNLSDREMAVLVNYAQHKAFSSFRSSYAREIDGGTCPAGGCA